jgi:hypothetical protein
MRGEKGKKRERREILVGEGKEADELGRNRKGFLPPARALAAKVEANLQLETRERWTGS